MQPVRRLSHNPSHRQNGLVGCISVLNARFHTAGMDDPAIPKVYGHMARITDQITRLSLRVGNFPSRASLFRRGSGDAVAKRLVNGLGETGAIRALRQACTSGHIGISHKLTGIIGNLLTFGNSCWKKRMRNRKRRSLTPFPILFDFCSDALEDSLAFFFSSSAFLLSSALRLSSSAFRCASSSSARLDSSCGGHLLYLRILLFIFSL